MCKIKLWSENSFNPRITYMHLKKLSCIFVMFVVEYEVEYQFCEKYICILYSSLLSNVWYVTDEEREKYFLPWLICTYYYDLVNEIFNQYAYAYIWSLSKSINKLDPRFFPRRLVIHEKRLLIFHRKIIIERKIRYKY